jgi:hypothetical protein
MTRFSRFLVLVPLCLLAMAAPCAAQSPDDIPAEAAEALKNGAQLKNCAIDCPPGMVAKTYEGGAPAFENCTEAYQYYVSNRYELILTLLLQYSTAYDSSFLKTCQEKMPDVLKGKEDIAQSIMNNAEAEISAIRPAMHALIGGVLSTYVPAHCRANKPAQDEVAALLDDWIEKSTTYYKTRMDEYQAGRGITQCMHFTSPTVARIYDVEFTGMPLLGVAAALGYGRAPESEEMKKAILDYKSAADAVLNKTAAVP